MSASKNKKHPGGRPSKKDQIPWSQLECLYKAGWTDKQVGDFYDVTEQTLANWKKKDPKFFEALKDWKLQADHKVERSLYERACGYSHPDTKAQFVQDDNGGRWEYAELTKHYPPDPTSMIFWLKNRQPGKWRDKQEHEHTGKDGGPIETMVNMPPSFKTIDEWVAWKQKQGKNG